MKLTRLFAFFVLLLYFSACTDSGIQESKQSIKIKTSDCKQFSRTSSADSSNPELDCIKYTYDPATKILQIKHINAAFNCCPDKISADAIVDSGLIRIEEKEKLLNPCKCNCLYDLDYEVKNVDAHIYILEVIEPYLGSPDEVLRFEVDFSKVTSGELCKKRTLYPWIF